MRNLCRYLGVFAAIAATALTGRAAERTWSFDKPADLADWVTVGDVGVDADRARDEGGSSLKVAPGAKALLKLRDEDASGKVTLWFYDDGAQRGAPKTRGSGPLAGIVTADGRVLVLGPIYAPYLTGNQTYALAEYRLADQGPLQGLTYLGLKRGAGWQKLSFDFDPETGLSILVNDRDLKNRFMWAKSEIGGFAGVAVLGDADGDHPQSVWIDDVTVELGGPMTLEPFESLVPAEDPVVEAAAARTIVPELAGRHPRLLFSREDVPAMRRFANSPRGRIYMETLEGYLDACNPPTEAGFLRDATDAQRQGFWRMPTVALHYVLTGDKSSFDKAVGYMKLLLSLEHWETGELDNGMSAANIMIGAGLTYDWLYNDLDPAFREAFRRKIWQHARRMYYAGHMKRDASGHYYWEGDPQNNHRWHRDAGLTACALAAAEGEPGEAWLLGRIYDEMTFVVDWLPDDGTSHESFGYTIFGGAHLMVAAQATDRCLGTRLLERPFFRHLPEFMDSSLTPGLEARFGYGDQGVDTLGKIGYDLFLLKCAAVHKLADHLAVTDALVAKHGVASNSAWKGLVWYPHDLAAGDYRKLATMNFFPDLGLLMVRQGWSDGQAAALFKCGPFGGYDLNRYKLETPRTFINVAHDDPDANSFVLFNGRGFVAETDRYSKHKKSANHNTILINGTGQTVTGRSEGPVFWQPGSSDMSQVAVVTALAEKGPNVAIEGEAAGSYPANPRGGRKRPALDRYRRGFFWINERYVLVLDDIRAPEPVEIDWLIQGPTLTDSPLGNLRYTLAVEQSSCDFQVAATDELSAEIRASSADNAGKPMGWQQLKLTATSDALRVASVYDLWGLGGLTVGLETTGPDAATVVVTGEGIADTWQWTSGEGLYGPSTITGRDSSGAELITLSQPEPRTRELLEANRQAAAKAAPNRRR